MVYQVATSGVHSIEENSIDKYSIEEKSIEKEKTKRFKKPTMEEIKKYCTERNNKINSEHFYDYYESNGWKVGKNSMKDWKATIRTWERNNNKSSSKSAKEAFLNG